MRSCEALAGLLPLPKGGEGWGEEADFSFSPYFNDFNGSGAAPWVNGFSARPAPRPCSRFSPLPSPVPKGHPRIAQCFNIGTVRPQSPQVPEGRPKTFPPSVESAYLSAAKVPV